MRARLVAPLQTATARIAATMARLPLVHAPLESLISKWYGEGEQKLAALFSRSIAPVSASTSVATPYLIGKQVDK